MAAAVPEYYLLEFPDLSNITDLLPTQDSLIDAFRNGFLVPFDAFYPPSIPGIPNPASLMPQMSDMMTVPGFPHPWISTENTIKPAIDGLHAVSGIIIGQFFSIIQVATDFINSFIQLITLPELPILGWSISDFTSMNPTALLDSLKDIYANAPATWAAIVAFFNLPTKWPSPTIPDGVGTSFPDEEVMAVLQEIANKYSTILLDTVTGAFAAFLDFVDDTLELSVGNAGAIISQIVAIITGLPTPTEIVALIKEAVPPLPTTSEILVAVNVTLASFGIPPLILPDPLIPNVGFPEFEITHLANQFYTQAGSFVQQLLVDAIAEIETLGDQFLAMLPGIPDYLNIGVPSISSLCSEVLDNTGLIRCTPAVA